MLKKKIPCMLLFLVLSVLSIFTVLKQSGILSLNELMELIKSINPYYFFLAVLSAGGFIIFEGLAIAVLVRGLCGKKNTAGGVLYAAADVYFSAITPSASGGQPASAFFMLKDKIPMGKTTVILLVNLIMYTYALLFCGGITFLFRGDILGGYEIGALALILIGIIVLLVLGSSFRLLLRKPLIVKRFLHFLINLGEKMHLIRNKANRLEKADGMVAHYEECSAQIKGKPLMLFICFVFNLLQRLSQCMVTVLCYLAMNGKAACAFSVWCIHVYTSIGSNSVPIPGAIGVSDYLLIKGLSLLSEVDNPVKLELFSRGLYFYICVLLSIIIMIAGLVFSKLRKKEI